jgi:uncharacterized protein YecE (DUF72 family)
MDTVIGTAGWSIPRQVASALPEGGTALERYSRLFSGVEINSSFYRPHRPATWARWAASVPDGFRFSVKLPKAITHEAKLIDADGLIARFAQDVGELGAKLAVLLVQLPPKLAFDLEVADRFFTTLRRSLDVGVVCEPRNATWFTEEAEQLLRRMQVARVAADPAILPVAATSGGWPGIAYWRLHGSPALYRSAYDDEALGAYAGRIAERDPATQCWCIFDNTASSAATRNALSLISRLSGGVAAAGPIRAGR